MKKKKILAILALLISPILVLGVIYGVNKVQELRSKASNTVYRMDLSSADWDTKLFVNTFQGIINRKGARLYVYDSTHPLALMGDHWYRTFSESGKSYAWLQGTSLSTITSVDQLISTFSSDLKGIVVWDPNVPATLNVATTTAGAYGWAVTTYSADANSAYQKVRREMSGITVFDMRGKFQNIQYLPNASFSGNTQHRSTGSAKVDAYLWAKVHLLDTKILDPQIIGMMADSWNPNPSKPPHYDYNRDFIVMKKGFAVDLDPWVEQPEDDPNQSYGLDHTTLANIIKTSYLWLGGNDVVHVFGFSPYLWYKNGGSDPFYWKYSKSHGSRTNTEWRTVEVITENGGLLNASSFTPNMSFHANAPKIGATEILTQKAVPPKQLENKTYIAPVWLDSGSPNEAYAGMLAQMSMNNDLNPASRTDAYGNIISVGLNYYPMNQDYIPDFTRYYYDMIKTNGYDTIFDAGFEGYELMSATSTQMKGILTNQTRKDYFHMNTDVGTMLDFSLPNSATAGTLYNAGLGGVLFEPVNDSKYFHGSKSFMRSPLLFKQDNRFGTGIIALNSRFLETKQGHPYKGIINPDSYPNQDIRKVVESAANEIITKLQNGSYNEIRNPGQRPNFLVLRRGPGYANYWAAVSTLLKRRLRSYNIEFVDLPTLTYLARRYYNNTSAPFSDINANGANSYRYSISSTNVGDTLAAGRTHNIQITVRNDGWDTWQKWNGTTGINLVRLFYDASGNLIRDISEPRTVLSKNVGPGQSESFNFSLKVPSGRNIRSIKFELVDENKTWFENRGNVPLVVSVP